MCPVYSSNEILSTAFSHAKVLLRSAVTPQDFASVFPSTSDHAVSNYTILDVQQCLQEARIKYEGRTGHAIDIFQSITPTTTIGVSDSQDTSLSKAQAKARMWLTGLSEKILYYG